MALCVSCGTDNPGRAKFCLECGAALPETAERTTGTRKLVTVLFADVVGSTALGERLDPETMRSALARYFSATRAIVERHGGTVEKFIGDAVMAVFGIPLLHEDDALRAVRAADELRREIGRLNEELSAERGLRVEFRIGVNSGMVVAGGGDASGSFVTGDAVNVAARLEQAAGAGEVLLGDTTHRLVRDYVRAEPSPPIVAKGKSDELRAFVLTGLVGGLGEAVGRADRRAPFVGRRRELTRLGEAFEDSIAERRCFLFTLLGSAGVGKSRLVAEFLAGRAGEASILRGRCLPYGEGITYWPIIEILRAATGATDDDDAAAVRARIADALGDDRSSAQVTDLLTSILGLTTVNAPAEERSWAVRRFFESRAREQPFVCLVEDVHWAEPALLDMLENVADWSRDAPILLLCTARPELLEARSTWGGGKVNAQTVLLEPLSADSTRELVAGLASEAGLAPGLVDRILATAEGNPLFAEEIVRMLADEGDTSAAGEAVQIPTSVQAVIAARLDRLPVDERAVAERAAVAGRVFERGAVLELVREDEREQVPTALLALMRKELVQPSQPDLTADEAFRFRHMLIRDTAYEGLPKHDRAELHERFAGWVERVAGDRLDEYAEILGYHFELSVRYRRELGLDDARTAALAERAGGLLSDAGQRAYLRGEHDPATRLLQRGVSLLGPGPARRAAFVLLSRAAELNNQYAAALEAAQHLAAEAKTAQDEGGELKASLLVQSVRSFFDPGYAPSHDISRIEQTLADLSRLGDDHGMAMAFDVLSNVYQGLTQWHSSGDAAEHGLDHALAAGDGPLADALRFRVVNAATWGTTSVPDLLALMDETVSVVASTVTRSSLIGARGLAHAMAGDAAEARADIAESLRLRRELGDPELAWTFGATPVEMVLGDLAAAEEAAKWSIGVLERLGETGQRSTIYGFRARVAFDMGRPDAEVAEYAAQCRRLAAADDAVSQLQWRAALALIDARAGRIDDAKAKLDEAAALMARSDFLYELGLTAQDRGYVHEQAGELGEARHAYAEALALFQRKGDVMDAARVRDRLAGLTGG